MITLEDLIDFSNLSTEDIEAIAECNQEPLILSIAQVEALLHRKNGCTIKEFFEKDILLAKRKGDELHALRLKCAYQVFDKAHPTS